jgi:hypothetical protein
MFRSVDWALIDHVASEPVAVGDLVSVDAGGMPIYLVMKVDGRAITVAGERDASARVLPLDLFRWRGSRVAVAYAA